MSPIRASFDAFIRDERGTTLIEYGFVMSLVSLTIISFTTQMGQSVIRFFQSMAAGFGP